MTVAVIERLGFEVDAIDVFCGWGGSSQGIHQAGATVKAAANHNALAIECHSRNYPDVEHWQADMVDETSPMVINVNGKKVPGRYLDPAKLPKARFAWFSPSCTHHSQANAKKIYERSLQMAMFDDENWDEQEYVNSERSRVTMSCVLRYVDANHPDIFVVENVLEVTQWGPGKDGSTFKWWMAEIRKLGYKIKCCFFNSMFFAPCPQSRDRVYIVCWKAGNKAPNLDYRPPAFCASDSCGGRMVHAVQSWKAATKAWRGMAEWGKYGAVGGQYLYRCPDCRAPVHPASWMALSALDLSDLGPTLGERKRLPADTTLERIRRSLVKFWNAPPVLLPAGPGFGAEVEAGHAAKGGSVEFRGSTARGAGVAIDNGGSPARYAANRSKSLTEALPALTRKNAAGLVTLAGIPMRSERDRSHGVDDQFATMLAGGKYGGLATLAVLPLRSGRPRAIGMHEQLATVLAGGEGGTGGTGALVVLIPNRTHSDGKHAGDATAAMTTSWASQGVIVHAAGNTAERPGQTRARHVADPLFAQTQTGEFGFAAVPMFRGAVDVNPEEIHVSDQLGTVTAGGLHAGLVTGSFFKQNGGAEDTAPHALWEALGAVTERDTTGLVLLPRECWIDQYSSDPVHVMENLAVLTTHTRHSLASSEPYEGEVTDDMLMQVRFRMLKPDPELRRAMAFEDGYILIGNQTQMTAGLGAAVTPPVATWITGQCMETFWEADQAA